MQVRSRQTLIMCLEAQGWPERGLARAASLGHATINHLVTGRRTSCSAETAESIALALNCPIGALFAPDS